VWCKFSGGVFLALGIQHGMRIRQILICEKIFKVKKGKIFGRKKKKKKEHEMCVLSFFTTFV